MKTVTKMLIAMICLSSNAFFTVLISNAQEIGGKEFIFSIGDIDKISEATVKWKKTYPNSNQIFSDAGGQVVWMEKPLSKDKLIEFMHFLKGSKFIPYAAGAKTLYKSHKYQVRLVLQDNRVYELIEADACSRLIILGSGEFLRAFGDCFNYGV